MPYRRGILHTIAFGGTAGLAGCSQLLGDDGEIQDTDGDGVIDSEDYAPRDPEVQQKSDIQDSDSPQTSPESEPVESVEVLRQPLPDPEPYIPSGREGHERSIGTVSVDTSEGTVVLDGPGSGQVTAIAGFLAADGIHVSGFQEGNNETKKIATNATFGSDELSFTPNTFEGIALRAVEGINLVIDGRPVAESVSIVRYNVSRGVFEQTPVGSGNESRDIPQVLEQPLPDPEQYIPSGRQGHERSIGTVSVETSEGAVVLNGPGGGQVTAIAGFLAADGIQVSGFQEGNNETKKIATNATFGSDELSFTPNTFEGIALRAVEGINLIIDGRTVAESVSVVRYNVSRGVFEHEG